jgi:RHS repeat-associated protein
MRLSACGVYAGRLAVLLVSLAVCAAGGGGPPRSALPVDARLAFSPHPTVEELFRARIFEEPLVPIGPAPSADENLALANALQKYSERNSPDDFSSITHFLTQHPRSSWRAALLTGLGIDYYNTAHYSRALEAWEQAWPLAQSATDAKGKAVADRVAGELASMYARLGRMKELEQFLESVELRTFIGSATEKITGAREGLWNMQNRPEIAFKCGPMALQQIKRALNPHGTVGMEIFNSASTQQGFSLPQVAELSKKIGLNYQMAFREKGGALVVPSVVHWKVGHYAGMTRQEGDRYLLEDPTFGNTVWASRETLEAETSGYFLIPPGKLPPGWRAVDAKEGASVWGKGNTGGNDQDPHGPPDPKTGGGGCKGMAVPSVHLMLVNLNLSDEPAGYAPPVGPAVRFTVRYNSREARQPANFTYANFGPKWTCDWISYITDNPQSPSADAKYYIMGGGTRTFTGFNTNTQSFAYQQYDQTRLTRTGTNSYQMLSRDGSKLIFSQSDGSAGTSRKIFLTQVVDPSGNAVTVSYDGNLRLVGITDAIGQVTTVTYVSDAPGDGELFYQVARVTDPFGRFATFGYATIQCQSGQLFFSIRRLVSITDTIGLVSRFVYGSCNNGGTGDFVEQLITPYGTNTFMATTGPGVARSLETTYPDGSRDRVEYRHATNIIAPSDLAASVPQGMATLNNYLQYRNTFYWSRNACATGYGDYSKAKLYHWLHAENTAVTAGILESTKEALEGRVWYDYAGQTASSVVVGNNNLPTHVGRVLDDGSTQLSTYAYDGFGHLINSIDPVGREMSYVYSTNGIDLLEVRQTRGANNELLSRTTYNAQHLPLTQVDAAGQTNTFTYNARGQVLTATNPRNETTAYTYDTNGYLVRVDGPLPGTNDSVTATYDAVGRTLTKTDESGYTLTFDYDGLDRLTKVTHPDGTFSEYTFNRLDPAVIRDRAGRQTFQEHDAMRQMVKRTDPLNRVSLFQWCSCGDLSSLTDPMGRTTAWHKDVQGRLTSKQYGDGSQVRYFYENAISRLRQVVDEKQQVSQFAYHRDNTLNSVSYANATVPTPPVSYSYDPNYKRVTSMTDGVGTTHYAYAPITAAPSLGAGQLASVDGPLSNDTITYSYDTLGRRVSTAINGVASAMIYDAAGRVVGETNALGTFSRAYDGSSSRIVTNTFPNGQTEERGYAGNLEDRELQRITHKVGATPVSEFLYGRDNLTDRITTWSQQAGVQPPALHTFGYDAADQLRSATVTNSGTLINSFEYTYDPIGNRLSEQVGASNHTASYNALNQLSTGTGSGDSRTNEWDAKDRLVAVNSGNQRIEFTYDGLSRLASLRLLTNGAPASFRRFVWCENLICEERDAAGAVTKRHFDQGMKIEVGGNAGSYFYTRDHLGSIRELTDSGGAVRARYDYDPFGRRILLAGDVEADFGLAGMFWSPEAGLAVTRFRIYDPELGRWLSRDPLGMAEARQGPNLYAYVANNPLNLVDPLGLCCEKEEKALDDFKEIIERLCKAFDYVENIADPEENLVPAAEACSLTWQKYAPTLSSLALNHFLCVAKGCASPKPCPKPVECTYVTIGLLRVLVCDSGEHAFF